MKDRNLNLVAKHVFELIRPQVETILQAFQRDLVGWQSKITQAWNTMNVIVRVLQRKGLITQEEVLRAGTELMMEAREAVQRTKDAAARGERVPQDELPVMPLDEIERVMSEVRKALKMHPVNEGEKTNGEEEAK